MRQRVAVTALFLAQVAEQIMHLRLVRRFDGEVAEDFFRQALGFLSLKHVLAPEAVAFDAAKTVRHQFVRPTIMRLGGLVHAKVRQTQRQPRLDAIRVGKVGQ